MGIFDKIKDKVSSAVKSTVDSVVKTTTEVFQLERLRDGLTKTRNSFVNKLRATIGFGRKIDEKLLEEIEEVLITSDIGFATTERIINSVRNTVKKENYENADRIYELIKQEILAIFAEIPAPTQEDVYQLNNVEKPFVMMMIGVNGVGKTTTIGKLAHNFKKFDNKVLIGAADTFRAAANEQLDVWAKRADVEIIQQKQGADPAAVVYDTLAAGIARKSDVILIDTAGRLHNKANLMKELEKINRVMKKHKESAPDEVFLVLDATTGQNAVQQAKEFSKVAPITGIVLTKLDGTAKGGVIIGITSELKIPVRFIGVGEKIDDLQLFDPIAFTDALFDLPEDEKVTNE
ncbi:MAG: signal recognition particle-docking protein FtsY [Candidatus Kapabacteria bacterium]|nr:signal recognition particle-docking protein FtsY [Candidatus Kapabacteria bacterium]